MANIGRGNWPCASPGRLLDGWTWTLKPPCWVGRREVGDRNWATGWVYGCLWFMMVDVPLQLNGVATLWFGSWWFDANHCQSHSHSQLHSPIWAPKINTKTKPGFLGGYLLLRDKDACKCGQIILKAEHGPVVFDLLMKWWHSIAMSVYHGG